MIDLALLSKTICRVLEYFGVYESTMETTLAIKDKGQYIFVMFKDSENKPWTIAFSWPDANYMLSERDYEKKVYNLALSIIRDFISQGAVLEENVGDETNRESAIEIIA